MLQSLLLILYAPVPGGRNQHICSASPIKSLEDESTTPAKRSSMIAPPCLSFNGSLHKKREVNRHLRLQEANSSLTVSGPT
ncbi:hypothetical protein GcC1_c1139o57 [Golovinomyces cichoracearum]|uniref:Secreted protein n=1 Tax=Golovinomyces cichoracearum TaxID=62708 RepID=A0A420J7G8_9PEZI|nr:hypothetical protein GcC1_c1139o57 [Golovinomyces cichoracearum]